MIDPQGLHVLVVRHCGTYVSDLDVKIVFAQVVACHLQALRLTFLAVGLGEGFDET